MPEVRLTDVRKQFPGEPRPVVDGVSLAVADREFVALLGPSGCGKTTLLRMICGLETPDSGEIAIGGKSVIGSDPKDRGVALVFQQYALYPQMTVRENLQYPLKPLKLSREEQAARVEATAAMLSIAHLLDRRPGELSGGEQQRVAVGRALIRKPAVLLMDEPLSNLDARLRMEMRSQLRALHDEVGTTTILVTHDQTEAMTMADRVILLDAGRIQQVGRPDDVYDWPANTFAARFIGSPPMNLVPAVASGGKAIAGDGWEIPLPLPLDGPVTVGIRPEGLRLVQQSDGAAGVFPVRFSETHGSEAIAGIDVSGETVLVRTPTRDRPQAGTLVGLEIDPQGVRLFDPPTGTALTDATSNAGVDGR